MRHSVIITVLLSALACLCGCTVGTPEIRHINIASHPFEWADTAEVIIGNPLQMLRTPKALYITDIYGDSVMHVVDLEERRYAGQFGPKGEGPGCFSDITVINPVIGNDDKIGLFDRNIQNYYEADVDFSRTPVMEYCFKFNSEEQRISFITPLSSGNYVITAGYDEHPELYTVLSRDGSVLGRYGDRQFSPKDRSLPPSWSTAAYQARIMIPPSGRRVASYISDCEIASFHDVDGDSVRTIRQICNSYPEARYDNGFKGVKWNVPLQFINGACDEDHVYILYSELCLDDGPFTAVTGNRILVYTWSGEQVAELHTDVRVRHFTAPDSTGRMYALTQDGCDPTLIYFDIPEL